MDAEDVSPSSFVFPLPSARQEDANAKTRAERTTTEDQSAKQEKLRRAVVDSLRGSALRCVLICTLNVSLGYYYFNSVPRVILGIHELVEIMMELKLHGQGYLRKSVYYRGLMRECYHAMM